MASHTSSVCALHGSDSLSSFLDDDPALSHFDRLLSESRDYISRVREMASPTVRSPASSSSSSSRSSPARRRKGRRRQKGSRAHRHHGEYTEHAIVGGTEHRCKGCDLRRRRRRPPGVAAARAALREEDCEVGPGSYNIPLSTCTDVSGGRFNMSNAKSDLDWVTYFEKQKPGPGNYEVGKLRLGEGGRFNEGNSKGKHAGPAHHACRQYQSRFQTFHTSTCLSTHLIGITTCHTPFARAAA